MVATPTTANHTGSPKTSNALETIVDHFQSSLKARTDLTGILAPSENIIRDLHQYANSNDEDVDIKDRIGEAFRELGEQIALYLRDFKQQSTAAYNGLIERSVSYSSKIANLLKPKTPKQKEKAEREVVESKIIDLVNFSESQADFIDDKAQPTIPEIRFMTSAKSDANEVRVDHPAILFKYIKLSYERNKLIGNGRPIDYHLKALIELAYCVKRKIEDNDFVATKKEIETALGLRYRPLKKEADDWNDSIAKGNQSAISDHPEPKIMTDNEIKKRKRVINRYNKQNPMGGTLEIIRDPRRLLKYLKVTKDLQDIRKFVGNSSSETEIETEENNPNFKSLDIVMQWFLQLNSPKGIPGLFDYAKTKHNITKDSDLDNIKRIKSMWNLGKVVAFVN